MLIHEYPINILTYHGYDHGILILMKASVLPRPSSGDDRPRLSPARGARRVWRLHHGAGRDLAEAERNETGVRQEKWLVEWWHHEDIT